MPMMFAVVIRGIAYVEPLDDTADVCIRGLHDEVVVGGHEAIGMDRNGKAFNCRFKVSQKFPPVAIIGINRFTGVASIDDMVEGPGVFDTEWSCHSAFLVKKSSCYYLGFYDDNLCFVNT